MSSDKHLWATIIGGGTTLWIGETGHAIRDLFLDGVVPSLDGTAMALETPAGTRPLDWNNARACAFARDCLRYIESHPDGGEDFMWKQDPGLDVDHALTLEEDGRRLRAWDKGEPPQELQGPIAARWAQALLDAIPSAGQPPLRFALLEVAASSWERQRARAVEKASFDVPEHLATLQNVTVRAVGYLAEYACGDALIAAWNEAIGYLDVNAPSRLELVVIDELAQAAGHAMREVAFSQAAASAGSDPEDTWRIVAVCKDSWPGFEAHLLRVSWSALESALARVLPPDAADPLTPLQHLLLGRLLTPPEVALQPESRRRLARRLVAAGRQVEARRLASELVRMGAAVSVTSTSRGEPAEPWSFGRLENTHERGRTELFGGSLAMHEPVPVALEWDESRARALLAAAVTYLEGALPEWPERVQQDFDRWRAPVEEPGACARVATVFSAAPSWLHEASCRFVMASIVTHATQLGPAPDFGDVVEKIREVVTQALGRLALRLGPDLPGQREQAVEAAWDAVDAPLRDELSVHRDPLVAVDVVRRCEARIEQVMGRCLPKVWTRYWLRAQFLRATLGEP